MILWTKHFSDAHHETRVIRWSTLHLHANNTHWHSSLASIVFASMTVFEMLRNQIGMIFWQVPSFIEVCWTRQAAIAKKINTKYRQKFHWIVFKHSSMILNYWTNSGTKRRTMKLLIKSLRKALPLLLASVMPPLRGQMRQFKAQGVHHPEKLLCCKSTQSYFSKSVNLTWS